MVQAKDISTERFTEAIRSTSRWGRGLAPWANRWDVARYLGMPEKVVLAKARKLIKAGVIGGCGCGCRGDFEVLK